MKASSLALMGGGLFIPGPAISGTGAARIELTASKGNYKFEQDQQSPTQLMFFNKAIPGPVIRIPQGQESIVELHNDLDEPTSVHWHGLRIDNEMDGVPGMTQDPIQPGESFLYRLRPPDAGTYWYHSHQRTWGQLAFGLAGILIVEEDEAPRVDQDLIFAVDDWRLDDHLQFDSASLGSMHDWSHGGRLGNWITINGRLDHPYRVSKGERIRFRMLNIANARTMKLRINQPLSRVIAIDGQPVKPYELKSGVVTLAPGQRSDLIIDISGEPNSGSPIELLIKDQVYTVSSFEVDGNIKRQEILESSITLPPNPMNRIQLPQTSKQVPLHIGGGAMGGMQQAIYQGREMGIQELIQNKKIWAFNGIAGLPDSPLFKVRRGSAVSLNIDNDNAWSHAMHIHGHHFIDQKQPGVWRDTALFMREEKGSLRFVADNPGKWLIHCHMIEHQAGGMITWFEVT